MSEIKLDPTKLLGFKVIASDDATVTLRSPKIGVKTLRPNAIDVTSSTGAVALRAKVGTKD